MEKEGGSKIRVKWSLGMRHRDVWWQLPNLRTRSLLSFSGVKNRSEESLLLDCLDGKYEGIRASPKRR